MSKHTPEPWRVEWDMRDQYDNVIGWHVQTTPDNPDDVGTLIVEVPEGRETDDCEDRRKADADRIVACVNAMEGIDDPTELRRSREILWKACQSAVTRLVAMADSEESGDVPSGSDCRQLAERIKLAISKSTHGD